MAAREAFTSDCCANCPECEWSRCATRIVQFGLQDHGCHTGAMRLETKEVGKIRVVFTSLNRIRESIGKVSGPQPIPASVDYNLWAGPAPLDPLMRKNLHYDWHWVWPTGTGELGNNGIYPLDACRLALRQSVLPKRVISFGGRFLFNGDGFSAIGCAMAKCRRPDHVATSAG